MKSILALLSLTLTVSAFADSAKISNDKKSVTITGSLRGATSEIVNIIDTAYEHGYKDSTGEDIFSKLQSASTGTRSVTKFSNKLLEATIDAGFVVNYKVTLKAKKGEISVSDESVRIQGNAADILMGAMKISVPNNGPVPVGAVNYRTKSGKIHCMKVVHPAAKANCTIAL